MPFTLSHVTLGGGDQFYNYVRPYPSLEKSVANDSESIINAVDICMGQNGILWVLDIGMVNTLEKSKKICGAKVLGIDYGNGRVSFVFVFRKVLDGYLNGFFSLSRRFRNHSRMAGQLNV